MAELDEIALLRKHYKENVLEPEPNQNFEGLKNKLKGRDGKKLLAEELSKWGEQSNDITEDDIDGVQIAYSDCEFENADCSKTPDFIIIRIPNGRDSNLMKKFGVETHGFDAAITCDGSGFDIGSPLYGTSIVLLSHGSYENYMNGHERFHVLHGKQSRSMIEMSYPYAAWEERLLEFASVHTELQILGELGAERKGKTDLIAYYRTLGQSSPQSLAEGQTPEMLAEMETKLWLKLDHCPYYAEHFSESISQIIPNCGAVSTDKAKTIAKTAMRRYLEDKVDEGMEALNVMEHDASSAPEVTQIILSCGMTGEEFESGEYMRPIDELVLWSKHYKEVLGVGQGGQ